MVISAYQQYIYAYQDFCLSSFMPKIIFISLKHLQHANQTSFLLFGRFLAVFLWSFSKNFTSEKQKLNTESLPKAENQAKSCKTIFQKWAKTQKCSNNKKHLPKAKNETKISWSLHCLLLAFKSNIFWIVVTKYKKKQKSAE